MTDFDCPTNGPGYYEPEGYEDACQEAYEQGAKSRDSEMRSVTDDLINAEAERDEAKLEIERLTRLLCAAGLIEAALRMGVPGATSSSRWGWGFVLEMSHG